MGPGKKKILIIDDDQGLVKSLVRVLRDYDVVSANDGPDGLALAASAKPDLILLDVVMPGMDGIEVLAKLTLMPLKPPVIMMTGDDAPSTLANARAIGVFAYIRKPLDQEEVLRHVQTALAFARRESTA